jgi:cytolysin (calcineurin-like family phosphatase)
MDRSAAGRISGGRAPYNVIAFAVGHNHGTGPMPNWINATYNGVAHRIPEFRPGAAFWKNAALIRVTPSVMDVGYVNSNNLSSPWISGSSFALPFPNQVWVKILPITATTSAR